MSSFDDPTDLRNWGSSDPGAEGFPRRDPLAGSGPYRGELGQVTRRPGEPPRFEVDGRAEVAPQDMYVVRIGGEGPGQWGLYPFRSLDEASQHARELGERYAQDPASVRQELSLPDVWAGPRGSTWDTRGTRTYVSVFRLPQGSPFITSEVAPQPEGADLAAGEPPRTYRGGGTQVQFTEAMGLDPEALYRVAIPETRVDDLTSDPPQRTRPPDVVIQRPPIVLTDETEEREARTAPSEEETPPVPPTTSHRLGAYSSPGDHIAMNEGTPTPAERAAARGQTSTIINTTPGSEHLRTQIDQSRTRTDDLGNEITRERNAGAQIGRDGAQLSLSTTQTTVLDEEQSRQESHSGSLNAQGEAQISYNRRTGGEGSHRTNTVASTVQFGDTIVEGAALRGRRETQDGRFVTSQTGYTVDVKQPIREPDGRWTVSGVIDFRGSLGGGAESQGATRRFGASGELGASHQQRFARRFATESEARAFYDDNTALLGLAQLGSFTGVTEDAVEELGVGESVGETTGGQVGLSGTASSFYLRGSVSFVLSGSTQVDVQRISSSTTEVTIRRLAGHDASGTFSSLGVGIGLGGGDSDITGAVLVYHTDTEAGRAALRSLLDHYDIPRGTRGPGWEVKERIVEGHETRATMSATAGMTGASVGTTTVETIEDAEGETTTRASGQHTSTVGTVLPDWLDQRLGLSGTETVRLQSQSGRGLSLSFTVDATDAEAASLSLARAIGGQTSRDAQGMDAGEWRLAAQMSEASFLRLVEEISTNSRRVQRAYSSLRHPRGAELQRQIATSTTADEARVLLAEFVSALGVRGAAYLREIAGDLQWSIRLVNSEVYTGEEGRAAARQRLQRLVREAAQTPSTAARGLEALHSQEADKLQRIHTEASELPIMLRQAEFELQQSLVLDIEEALHQARRLHVDANQDHNAYDELLTREADVANRSMRSGEDVPRESSIARYDQQMAEVEADRRRRRSERMAMEGDLERATAKNTNQRRLRDIIFAERRFHQQGLTGMGHSAPRDWLSTFFNGESSTYDRIDGVWREGERHRRRGERLLVQAQAAASASTSAANTASSAEQVTRARQLAWRSHDAFAEALRAWRRLTHEYRGLRNRNPGTDGFSRVSFSPPE
ncbi:MAG: hypothetical protein AAGA48_04200 [Myxococcota bacterium]